MGGDPGSNTMAGRQFLDEKALSALLGITAKTLQTWRGKGWGPPFRKLCGSVRYEVSAVSAWIDSHPEGGDTGTETKGAA